MKYQLYLAATIIVAVGVACSVNTSTGRKGAINQRKALSAADTLDVAGCPVKSGSARIICLADSFKSNLNATQLAAVQLPYSVASAKRWSNLPNAFLRGNEGRPGLAFGSMNNQQIRYAKALVKAASGTDADEGWDELQQLMYADDYLKANGGGRAYGEANYYLALLGTPAKTGTFELQFGGHHSAFANTYKDGVLVGATPSFRGVEPYKPFTWNGKTNQPIQQERATLSAMLSGLTATQQATAKLNATFDDLVVGPHNDGAFPATASGIPCSSLSAAQKELVLKAIATYVGDIADSEAITAKYTKELNSTYISYSGTTDLLSRNDYVRLDGPSIWLEYSCQGGIVLPATHPHSVWRDKRTDYGGNL